MGWYNGELPKFIPICRKRRQGMFSKEYPIELWDYQAVCRDAGEGVKDWVKEAKQEGRKIAIHFYIPGTKIDRLFTQYRDFWHKAWREAAKYVEFSLSPEFDCWYTIPLLEGKILQHKTMELTKDMLEAGIPMIWLLLETKEGGIEDLKHYAGYANKHKMRWVTHNLTGARQKDVFFEQLQVYAKYHTLLNPDIGIIVNGVSSDKRIRMIKRVFKGREVVISNAARIEMRRRALS